MKHLCILGSTGSIGVSTLKVVAQFPEKFSVRSMTAGSNVALFAEQVLAVRPARVAIANTDSIPEFKRLAAGWSGEVLGGVDGLVELAEERESDYVVSAIVGAAGTSANSGGAEKRQAGRHRQQRTAGHGRAIDAGGCEKIWFDDSAD